MELPPELEREIVEYAIRDDPTFADTLKLVAHRVNVWAEEILQEYVVLDRAKAETTFPGLEKSKRPPLDRSCSRTIVPRYSKRVSSLCVTYNHDIREDDLDSLGLCTEVTQLACWIDYQRCPKLASIIAALPLQRLSIEVAHFTQLPVLPSPSCLWTQRLTHLDLVFWRPAEVPSFVSFDALPNLQHLCFNWGHYLHPWTVTTALTSCHLLTTLIILLKSGEWDELETYQNLPEATGVNIIVMPSRAGVHEWKPGANTVWERAKEFLASRANSSASSDTGSVQDVVI